MPKRAGKRLKVKRLRYLIKQTIISNKDPLLLIIELDKLLSPNSNSKISTLNKYILIKIDLPNSIEQQKSIDNFTRNYKLEKIDFEVNFPNYNLIKKTDPRYKIYKIRYLFGED